MRENSENLRLAIIGFGNRGQKYMAWVLEHRQLASVAAVVDSDDFRRSQAAGLCAAPVFETSEDLFRSDVAFDAVIIATPDKTHFAIATRAMSLGKHVLVEKPMAVSKEECLRLVESSSKNGVILSVCHILRFHPYCLELKRVLENPQLGMLMSVHHTVNVGIDRAVHTFVRGLWGREEDTAPVFLSKCSHDVDFLLWMCGSRVKKQSSYGSLSLFKEQNAPQGSTDRCCNCPVEKNCQFSAVDLYKRRGEWTTAFEILPGETLADSVDRELAEGVHGRCAYRCNNDVADHQTLLMELENGAVVSLLMNFLTKEDGRDTYFSFSGGEVWADGRSIKTRIFATGQETVLDCSDLVGKPLHCGADYAVVQNFVDAIRGKECQRGTFASQAVESHIVCLDACEQAKN